jgi:hypothetical protein
MKLTKKQPGRLNDKAVHVISEGDDLEIRFVAIPDDPKGRCAPIHPTEGRELAGDEQIQTPVGSFYVKRAYGSKAQEFTMNITFGDVSWADRPTAAAPSGRPTVEVASNASAKRIDALVAKGYDVKIRD